ncbi:MAG: molybdopterin molybdotransferase MoeA [bacterium]|nr:molybdopterin molybdotransferase MoeA [bacterium]
MIKVENAQNIILENIETLEAEKVDLLKALSKVLAEDIHSDINIPPFDNSAMDGFALKSSDTKGASQQNPIILKIIENLPAGKTPKNTIHKGEATRIMTGAPMPLGGDGVIMVEYTESTNNEVKIYKAVSSGKNIRLAGEDVKKKELVLKKGSLITPAKIGMLASVGKEMVKVIRTPKIAILTTGDELVELGEKVTPGKIRNSNTYTLISQITKLGAIPVNIGIACDNIEEIRNKIRSGIQYDMLITSGGISVGDYDLIQDILKEAGLNLKFWKVRVKPGKPILFGLLNNKPVFSLPGYPVSSMIAFELFVRPAILKMLGRKDIFRKTILATLTNSIDKKTDRRQCLMGILKEVKGGYEVSSTLPQEAGMLKSMTLANCLILAPQECAHIHHGTLVKVILLNDKE